MTVVAGGPGFGKTVLLAQAWDQNRQLPQGEDLWVGVEPGDDDGTLAAVVAAVVGVSSTGGQRPAASVVAEALWHRAPLEVCLLFDDVHRLGRGTAGGRWLDELVAALPANGHVVLAGRHRQPPIALSQLKAQGQVQWITEDDLRFADAELAELASDRGVRVEQLASSGGWPAMAELAATAGDKQWDYLWEAVLAPLPEHDRLVLAALCDIGGADDDLMAAVLGRDVRLIAALANVPMVERGADGWYVPHALWDTARASGLLGHRASSLRRRAAIHLCERQRFEAAWGLVREAKMWDLAPRVLRAAAIASDRHRVRDLGSWVAACPAEVAVSPAGRLAAAVAAEAAAPTDALMLLRAAAASCREIDDVEAELVAIAKLARLGWFRQDRSALGPELGLRVVELAAAGHARAQALAAFGRAVLADIAGDDEAVLSALADVETGALGPSWEVMAGWLYGMVQLGTGDTAAARGWVERLGPSDDPALRITLEGLRLRTLWAEGNVDEVLRDAPAAIEVVRRASIGSHLHLVLTNSSVLFAYAGDLAQAQRCLDEGTAAAPPHPSGQPPARTMLATAALQVARGDEDNATATLQAAIATHGLDRGVDRRGWRHLLALTYVLIPESRPHWQNASLSGYLVTVRQLAQAVVTARAGTNLERLSALQLPAHGAIRSALPVPLAVELAAGVHDLGRPEGAQLLEALGPTGRTAARALVATDNRLRRPTRALLASLPAPPPHTVRLAVLGPLRLQRLPDGQDISSPDLRRRRVLELLAFLVIRPTTTRGAIYAALWPDLPEHAATNNLSVTLNHLLGGIEPWRTPGEASYFLRLDRIHVRLVTDANLRTDIDEFHHELQEAHRHETDGAPSIALGHLLAAVDLYRGDLFADLTSPWIALDRERHRSRFLLAATRAAQLLTARGDDEHAERIAHRALDIDPLNEPAHTALVTAALHQGDHVAALEYLQRCLTALHDLGMQPSPATRQLRRRIQLLVLTAASGPASVST